MQNSRQDFYILMLLLRGQIRNTPCYVTVSFILFSIYSVTMQETRERVRGGQDKSKVNNAVC